MSADKILNNRYFFAVLLLIAVVLTFVVYGFRFNAPPIRSDGLGYYAYLPAIFVHGSLDMQPVVQERLKLPAEELPETWTGITFDPESEVYINKYPIGVAVMQLPFFLVAQVSSFILQAGDTEFGFSIFHQGLVGFAGIFYMVAGLYFLKHLLLRYFSPGATLYTILALFFGTNLLHYGTYDSSFSHTFSFMLFTLFLWLTTKWHDDFENPPTWLSSLLGLIAGMIVIVRPANVFFLGVFLLYGIFRGSEKSRYLIQNWKQIFTIVLATIPPVLTQVIYWKLLADQWFIFGYGLEGEGFNWLNPEFANVLFSARKGLFFWTPILLLAVIGFWYLRRYAQKVVPTLLYLLLNLYIIASWWAWFYGGSYGHRAFIESFVLFAFGFAALWERFKSTRWRKWIIATSILFVVLNLMKMWQYWIGAIPIDGTTLELYLQNFFQLWV